MSVKYAENWVIGEEKEDGGMGEVHRMNANGSSSDAFMRRVNGEISPREYVKSLDHRVSERRKSDAREAERAKKKSS